MEYHSKRPNDHVNECIYIEMYTHIIHICTTVCPLPKVQVTSTESTRFQFNKLWGFQQCAKVKLGLAVDSSSQATLCTERRIKTAS